MLNLKGFEFSSLCESGAWRQSCTVWIETAILGSFGSFLKVLLPARQGCNIWSSTLTSPTLLCRKQWSRSTCNCIHSFPTVQSPHFVTFLLATLLPVDYFIQSDFSLYVLPCPWNLPRALKVSIAGQVTSATVLFAWRACNLFHLFHLRSTTHVSISAAYYIYIFFLIANCSTWCMLHGCVLLHCVFGSSWCLRCDIGGIKRLIKSGKQSVIKCITCHCL